jgi:hypothetical protein
MPCYDSRDEPENVRKEALAEFTHNSPVAALLCEAVQIIKAAGLAPKCSNELLQWDADHTIRDIQKKQRGR